MTKFKLVVALVLATLAVIVVFQNTEQVETKLLFMTIQMPRAALLGITLLIGIAAGVLVTLYVSARRSRDIEHSAPQEDL